MALGNVPLEKRVMKKVTLKKSKKYKKKIIYKLLLLLEKIPFFLHKPIGNVLAYLLLSLSKTRRENAYNQLKIAFPHWDKKQIKKIALANAKGLGFALFESIQKEKYKEKIANWIENKNNEELEKIKKTGAIFFSGHFGNWELTTIALNKTKLKGMIIGTAKDLLVEKILQRYRKSINWENVFREDSSLPLKIVKYLKKNQSIYMLLDLDLNVKNVMCTFFGKKTRCPASVAKIAIKYQKPVVACLNHRNKKGKHIFQYRIISKPPYKQNTSIQHLSQKYTKIIENHIKEYPTQWNWSESRWKTERWTKQEKQQ